MPQYSFLCDTDDGGCGCSFNITSSMSKYDKDVQNLSCPTCGSKSVYRDYLEDNYDVNMPKTLGMYADRRSSQLSKDELHHINKKNNEYREGGPAFESSDGTIKKVNR